MTSSSCREPDEVHLERDRFPIKEGDVRIFRRKSRWQRLLEKLASMSKKPAIKGGAAAATGAVALTAASAAVSSYRRRTNA